jgi:ribonuclease-3
LVLPDRGDNPPYTGFFFSAGFYGNGSTKREARMMAARKAYEDLDRRGMLILPIDEVGYPDRDRAINQLQELYQKGFIAEPKYVFKETYDRGGNPLWRCECHVADQDIYCYDDYTSKISVKQEAAYEMLCHVLGVKG